MYRITPDKDLKLKIYWCTSLTLAQQVAREIQERFQCTCKIEQISTKQTWDSQADEKRTYQLGDVRLVCSQKELVDALQHRHNDVLKINSDEIFCLLATDALWQQQHKSHSG